jgi:predicted polyphosphate/ATP-dependent NAD kinase
MRRGGIIANPAAGKDIRRLVAHGSTFDNNEKVNIVHRVLQEAKER